LIWWPLTPKETLTLNGSTTTTVIKARRYSPEGDQKFENNETVEVFVRALLFNQQNLIGS
jgi:hypothetical protein